MTLDRASLERIVAALPGPVFGLALSPSGELSLRYVGEGVQDLFGAEPEALVADFASVLAAVHPDDVAPLRHSLEESARTLSGWAWQGRAFAADGNLRYVHGIAEPCRQADGTTVWDGVLLDETESHWDRSLEAAMRRRLEFIVRHLPASSVVLYDRELRLCFCEGQLFADVDVSALLGRRLDEIVTPETRELMLPALEAALAGEPTQPVVLERDIRGRTLAINFSPYRLADGRVDGAIVHWQDISELHDAERARAEAEELLARGFDDAPIGMALVAPDGRWLRVNQALCETVGYTVEELRALTFQDITHPDDRHADPELIEAVLADEIRSYQLEKRYVHKSGRTVWVNLSVSLARDKLGRPLYFVAQIEDITQRRRAEQELAQARAEIDRFFALSPELMAIANGEGYFVRINPAFETTLGYSREELLSRPFIEFVHPDDVEASAAHYARIAEGHGAEFENRCRCRDGSYRWLEWSATGLQDGYCYAVGRDVTERHEMEERLRRSREQALSASRMKSEFLANMSHEIRTPLNGVISMAELLLDTELTEEQREYAQVTATSGHVLMQVIDDILDFSKIEAGKLEIVKDDYAIERVVAEVCEIVGPKAREKQLKLSHHIDARVPAVLRGDQGRVRQVLMNLVGNAVKFTSAGEVAVVVSLTADRPGAERLRIEVSDTGIGVDPELLPTLFQPFSQADATTTRRYGGTGLGLSIARQLVELMDGEIGVRSAPGVGSKFWLELPCEPGEGIERESAARDLTGIRMLIVAADPGRRLGLEHQSARWGMIPYGVDSAAGALELLGRAVEAGRPFELALIAGDLDGAERRELVEAIEGSPRLRSTRRLLIDAGAREGGGPGADAEAGEGAAQASLHDELVAALETSAQGEQSTPRPQQASEAGGACPRVLVVEDNEINQFVALRMIQKLGFRVELAANGREAIELTARTPFAAVFMDCQMPEVDGYQATKAIRLREGASSHTPIIAMTANTMAGDRERCLAAGMDDYLPKPLRFEQVAEACRRLAPAGHDGLSAPAAEPAEPARPALYEPAALEAIADPRQAAELLELFLVQLDGALAELSASVAAGERESTHRLAHRLKGSAATIGAPTIAEACQAICQLMRSPERAAHGPELYDRLADDATATAAEIRSYLAGLAAPAE